MRRFRTIVVLVGGAAAFWTAVTVLQMPWRALARWVVAPTSPAPLPSQANVHDEIRRRSEEIPPPRMDGPCTPRVDCQLRTLMLVTGPDGTVW